MYGVDQIASKQKSKTHGPHSLELGEIRHIQTYTDIQRHRERERQRGRERWRERERDMAGR